MRSRLVAAAAGLLLAAWCGPGWAAAPAGSFPQPLAFVVWDADCTRTLIAGLPHGVAVSVQSASQGDAVVSAGLMAVWPEAGPSGAPEYRAAWDSAGNLGWTSAPLEMADSGLGSVVGAMLHGGPDAPPSALARATLVALTATSTTKGLLGVRLPSPDDITAIARARSTTTASQEINARVTMLDRLGATAAVALPGLPILPCRLVAQDSQLIRDLVAARESCAALRGGRYAVVVADNEDKVWSFARIAPEGSVAVFVANLSDQRRTVSVAAERLTARGVAAGARLTLVGDETHSRGLSPSPRQFTVGPNRSEVSLPAGVAALYISPR